LTFKRLHTVDYLHTEEHRQSDHYLEEPVQTERQVFFMVCMKRTKIISLVILAAIILTLLPLAPSAAFTPAPKTQYAAEFITACESQQWFIDYVERILNDNQKTLDNINNSSDLDIIKSIGLSEKGITGNIPKAIGELKELRTLLLPGNNLSGVIPAELFTLPKLYNIDLSYNSYAGAIPEGFGTMASLEVLNLRGNRYTGSVPARILSNTVIKTLDVSGNRLAGPIPAGLSGMTGLEYLAVSDNPWTPGVLPDLSTLTNLISLSAWNCYLTGEMPEFIYGLTKLQVIDLADNALTGEISASIMNLSELKLLALGRNQLTGVLPDAFDELMNLDTVDISDNKLRGALPGSFAEMQMVYAQNNYMTGATLKDIANNENNFCDNAVTAQYKLTATHITVSKVSAVNVYSLLRNMKTTTGNTYGKPVLPADCYEAWIENDPDDKVELTADQNGIYITALEDIAISENIVAVVRILGNEGSEYSTVRFKLTTFTLPGGGGMLSVSSTEEEEVTPISERHNPFINGYPDSTFRPERTIKREEVAAMIIRALDIESSSSATAPFADVNADRWSAGFISASKIEGYLTGYPSGAFKPNQAMTRAELAALLVRIAEHGGEREPGSAAPFTDVREGQWYTWYITEAAALGIVTGYSDGTFKPDRTVTRAEAVAMIDRMLCRDPETAPELESLKTTFSDVTKDHWAYKHIMEASMPHEHPTVDN